MLALFAWAALAVLSPAHAHAQTSVGDPVAVRAPMPLDEALVHPASDVLHVDIEARTLEFEQAGEGALPTIGRLPVPSPILPFSGDGGIGAPFRAPAQTSQSCAVSPGGQSSALLVFLALASLLRVGRRLRR